MGESLFFAGRRMKPQRFTSQFATFLQMAVGFCASCKTEALLLLLEGPADWDKLKESVGGVRLIVAADTAEELAGAAEDGVTHLVLGMREAPVQEKLTKALLESVAQEFLQPGAEVVAVYSSFEADTIDTLSYIRLEEHLGRLTARDLRKLESSVPLGTLKTVMDLAIEIGREGREGKPVGTMFVIGDTRRVLTHCNPAGYDPVRGYKRTERDLHDAKVCEAIKEIAMLDGAFIVGEDGVVEKACQLVDAMHANITLSKGLGARHWAGAAISRNTKAVAIVVSESSGTVRLFQNGEVVLRVEPFRRAMTWKNFEYEPPPGPEQPYGFE